MIITTHPSKPFTYNPKGAPKRNPILADYDSEIEALYKAVAEGLGGTVEAPKEWTLDASMAFTRDVVQSSLKHLPNDGDDLFDHGCDSLQATFIRQNFLSALHSQPDKLSKVGSNFVYEFPTISLLAEFCCTDLASADTKGPKQILEGMLEKYTTELPFAKHISSGSSIFRSFVTEKDVVLVTGTSGALGSAALAQLVSSDSVGKIYALNRPSRDKKGVLERQKEALAERGYDPLLAESSKVVLLEADLTEVDFGLSPEFFDEVSHL